jgi:hypothetical protein
MARSVHIFVMPCKRVVQLLLIVCLLDPRATKGYYSPTPLHSPLLLVGSKPFFVIND